MCRMLRRAIGKGGRNDSTSPGLIKAFNHWKPRVPDSTISTQVVSDSIHSYTKQQGTTKKSVNKTQDIFEAFGQETMVTPATSLAKTVQEALNKAEFSVSEVLTKKYTIFEFLERIGVQVLTK